MSKITRFLSLVLALPEQQLIWLQGCGVIFSNSWREGREMTFPYTQLCQQQNKSGH